MKLYELTQNYKNLLDLLEDDNIPISLIENSLKEIEEDFTSKCENISKLIKELTVNVDALKVEEKRLKERRLSLENNIINLKSYLQSSMISLDKKKIKGNMFTISIRKNAPSVVINDLDNIPSEFVKEIIEFEVDKKAILKEFKENNNVVSGVKINQSQSLMIR